MNELLPLHKRLPVTELQNMISWIPSEDDRVKLYHYVLDLQDHILNLEAELKETEQKLDYERHMNVA